MGDWDPPAVATFCAAVIAGVVGLIAIAVTVVDGVFTRRASRELTLRHHSWIRWSWIAEKISSDSPGEREVGSAILNVLSQMPWFSTDDELIEQAVSSVVVREPSDAPGAPVRQTNGGPGT